MGLNNKLDPAFDDNVKFAPLVALMINEFSGCRYPFPGAWGQASSSGSDKP